MRPYHWITLAILLALAFWFISRTDNVAPRVDEKIDLNWKFILDDPVNAYLVDYDDSDWRYVTLPHDWMIEQGVEEDNESGKAGGFYPSGVGWYRKSLNLKNYQDRDQFYLMFEGIYMNADVYFNGNHLGKQINGYTSFYYDVSKLVRKDTMNVIAVRTDCSKLPVDRWYSGAGIYRHVRLIATNRIHIPVWGCNVRSIVNEKGQAEVLVALEVNNRSDRSGRFEIMYDIVSNEGKVVAEGKRTTFLNAGDSGLFEKEFTIDNPTLWSPKNPVLYTVNCYIRNNHSLYDQLTVNHGIRSITFDPEMGLLVNDKKIIMKGVCLHHDGGELGAAISEAGWERRLKILKKIGVNSIRFAHNPHSPGVLDLCDRMGFLVIDEMFDKWETAWNDAGPVIQFSETWEHDLSNFIKRDRNHPSVVLWSVGNEVEEQRNDPARGRELYRSMIDLTRSLDPTREVTCAMHPGYEDSGQEIPSSMIPLANVVAYNYRTDNFEEWRKEYPDKIFLASETRPYNTYPPADFRNIDFSGNSWFDIGQNVAGQFIWAGIDYLGESPGWPDRGFKHGVLETNGFLKPIAYFLSSIYSDEPMVKLTVVDTVLADSLNHQDNWQIKWASPPLVDHWTFSNDSSYKDIVIFTNCESVELSLNNKVIDTLYKKDFEDGVIQKSVQYEKGDLIARAFHKDRFGEKATSCDTLRTAGKPYAITMNPDKFALEADGTDMLHITTKIVDSIGTLNPHSSNVVNYKVEGPGELKVIDNGDLADHTPYGSASREVRNGRQLVIIQVGNEPGDLIISAKANGLNPAQVKIPSKK